MHGVAASLQLLPRIAGWRDRTLQDAFTDVDSVSPHRLQMRFAIVSEHGPQKKNVGFPAFCAPEAARVPHVVVVAVVAKPSPRRRALGQRLGLRG